MKKIHQIKICMPEDVKNWVRQESVRNLRSQTSEIILALREKMAAETEKADAQRAS